MRFSRRFHLPRAVTLLAPLSITALLLGACNTIQFDPSGQNSGSPQNSQGAFNLIMTAGNVVKGSVGQTVNVYDTFTSVTTAFTITAATPSTTPANQNDNTQTLAPGMQYLVLDISIKNTSADANSCPNKGASGCVENISPLSNFRLIDDQARQWPSTTGAGETCSTDPHTLCASRDWITEATNGIAPGQTYTNRVAFNVPSDQHLLTLYFAPYRFADTNGQVAGGANSGKGQPTLAAITLSI